MQQEINRQRIQNMYQMLLEMAGGNFTNRIQRTKQDDELEALVVLINMVAEELKESVFHSGFVNPHYTYNHVVEITFVLDADFFIRGYNSTVPKVLGFSPDMLDNKAFSSILSKESLPIWNSVAAALGQDATYNSTQDLIYMTQDQLVLPCFCTISRLTPGTSILVSAVITVIADAIAAETLVSADDADFLGGLNSYSDVQLMQHVYDYILNHLDSPLPSMKALSRIFGTNENKLKCGFKHLFKMGIYQFYAIERLKRAHLLIQQTTIPLKSIAIMAGYPIYPNFSRAFKKRFGYPPMDVKRRLSGVLLWIVSTEFWGMSYGL